MAEQRRRVDQLVDLREEDLERLRARYKEDKERLRKRYADDIRLEWDRLRALHAKHAGLDEIGKAPACLREHGVDDYPFNR